jgi:nucleoside phosphorylase/tetratricopeptide (TPR) repeat protein
MPPAQAPANLDPRDYSVVWIAPLEIEAQAALHLLDERHRGRFPAGRGDDYVYHAGSMGGHNVVIATLPAGQEYGTGSAAALAGQLKKFFPNLWFGLLVGVAAGLPNFVCIPPRDIRLGDVLIGHPDGEHAAVVPYDLGKETEDGFKPLRLGHALAATEPIVRSAIGSMKVEAPNDTDLFLPYYDTIRNRQHATGTFADPGQDRDVLYLTRDDETDEKVERDPRPSTKRIRLWYGPIGSGEKLLKNAQKRNELRDKYGLIGLEMEAAGVMNRIPVGVIRGVCDYGDRHKNKDWQPYAAAMAASYGRALLDKIQPQLAGRVPMNALQVVQEAARVPCYHIPLKKNTRFTGRDTILDMLNEKVFGEERSQRTALVGLGGMGKTQIALHFAYQTKRKRPEYSILWIPILSMANIEQAYGEIAKKLHLEKKHDGDDIRELVCEHLNADEAGKWLIIVDNADDQELVFGSDKVSGIEWYLPDSENGSILLTTRSRQIAVDFADIDVIDVEHMEPDEAASFFEKALIRKILVGDQQRVTDLLTHLTYLPLAISQAAAYLNQTGAPIQAYLRLLQGAEKDVSGVLGREFRDNTRYRDARNAVGTTWLVSFDQIERSDQKKAVVNLLMFLSCIEPKAIPQSMLPTSGSEELEWAVGTLCGYSFLVRREDGQTFDMHSLVHMAIRGWVIGRQGTDEQAVNLAMRHWTSILPSLRRKEGKFRSYLPHALRLFYENIEQETENFSDFAQELGATLLEERRPEEALRCCRAAYRWKSRQLPEESPSLIMLEKDLGTLYLDTNQTKDAIEILERVAARSERLTKSERLQSEHELGRAYLENGQLKKAIEILERVIAVYRESLPDEDYDRLATENMLAVACLQDGRVKEGTEMLRRSVMILREIREESDYIRLVTEYNLAFAHFRNGQYKEAVALVEHVVAVESRILGNDHPSLHLSLDLLRRANERLGESDQI